MPRTTPGLLLFALCAGCVSVPYQAGLRTPLASRPESVHTEGRFEGERGVSLFEESWRPAQGSPRGVLVVMHGLKDHADRYQGLAQHAVAQGYAVYAFDLRGHGDSAGPRVWVDRFDDYVADLKTFLARVRSQEPGKPLFLLGHSMGGTIAFLATVEDPHPPNGLILSAAALRPGSEVSGFQVFATSLLGIVAPTLAVLDLKDERFSRDPGVAAAMHQDPLIHDGPGPARTARELLSALDRVHARQSSLQTPVLLLHGTADQVTNPEGSRELSEKAGTSDRTLILYPGLFHDLLHEPEHDEVMLHIVRWMNAHSTPVASAAR